MRVVAFVEYFPPRLGSDRRIFEIMKRLSHNHEVHFIVFPSIRTLLDRTHENERKRQYHHHVENISENHEGIIGHSIGIPRLLAAMWQSSVAMAYLLTIPLLLIKTTNILAKVKPNIIVLNYPSPYTGLLGFIEGKIWRKPVILDFNDLIAEYTISLLNIKRDSFTARLLVLVQCYIAKNTQKIIAPTHLIEKYANSLGLPHRNIEVIPNGVDTEIFDPDKYDTTTMKEKLHIRDEKMCLYCGRLDSWAGINIILRLCDVTDHKGFNTKFVFVGSGNEETIHKKKAVFLGEISYEKVPSVLAAADVILVPFPKNDVSHAASPLKLFEGMAMQKPVIASRVSGIEEIISDGENGFLVDADNIDEWSERLQQVLISEPLAAKTGRNARRTVEERFSWSLLAKQFGQVMDSTTPNRRQSHWHGEHSCV